MPDSMNFANGGQPMGYGEVDPALYGQQGWNGQYGAQQAAYPAGAYPGQDPYQQGMYPQGYQDPMAQQQAFQDPMAQQAYYNQQAQQAYYPQMDPNQMAQMDPNQMMQPGYPGADPAAAAQAALNAHHEQAAYAMNPESDADRMARQAQLRASSIYGPKELNSPKIAEVEQAGVANPAASMAAGMAMAPDPGAPTQDLNQLRQQAQAAPTAAYPAQQPQMAAPAAQGVPPAADPMQAAFAPQTPPPAQQPPAQQAPAPQASTSSKKGKKVTNVPPATSGQATVVFICGLLSIVFALVPPIGIILGWVSMRVSKKYIQGGGTASRADSGRIFGIVGFVFSLVMLFVMIIFIAYMMGALTGVQNARALVIYFNNSPLGSLITIPLA